MTRMKFEQSVLPIRLPTRPAGRCPVIRLVNRIRDRRSERASERVSVSGPVTDAPGFP
jgi:hypothetical protein